MSRRASVFSANAGALAKYAQKVVHLSKPQIEVELDPNANGKYTTGSSVSGKAIITSSTGFAFDEIQIALEGVANVRLEHTLQTSGHYVVEASHVFLDLKMPFPERQYPMPRVVDSHSPLTIPFNFVIPDRILPQDCSHACASTNVQDAHLHLPPSMGDSVPGPDSLTPATGAVCYSVKAKLMKKGCPSAKSNVLSTGQADITVLPQVAELPPLHISPKAKEYQFIQLKTLRKGMLMGKLGKVTLSSMQPNPFILSSSTATPPTLIHPLAVRFYPQNSSSTPPRIGTVIAKMKTSTFAAVKAQKDLATNIEGLNMFDPNRSVYVASTPLASLTIDSESNWKWIPESAVSGRHDSAYSTASASTSSTASQEAEDEQEKAKKHSKGYYEATILIPLTLPSSQTWIPTFHSCLVSRIYSIEFKLGVSPAQSSPASVTTNLTLKLPIQLTCGSSQGQADSARDSSSIEEQVDEDFRPRTLSTYSSHPTRDSADLSPTSRPVEEGASEFPPRYAGGLQAYMRRRSEAEARGVLVAAN